MPPRDRSVGAALVLTFFFGPLGLLYVSVEGGVLMTLAAGIVFIVTLGVLLPVFWVASMIWGGVQASNQHSAYQAWLVGQAGRPDSYPPDSSQLGRPSTPAIPPPPPQIPLSPVPLP